MLDLPIVEDSCSPEEGVTSFLVIALSADVPHHTPSLVSETLNGTFAYLRHGCLLTHTTVHPAASKLVEPETSKVDPVETSSKSDYLETLPGLNLRRSQFAEQQQKDYWCSLAFKFLSSGGDKATLSRIPRKHLQWAQHFSKRAAVIDGVLMYRDDLMDNLIQIAIAMLYQMTSSCVDICCEPIMTLLWLCIGAEKLPMSHCQ